MTGKTHKLGGIFGMLIAFKLLKDNNLLLPHVNQYLQLALMYPAAYWGSIMPDLDIKKSSASEDTPVSKITSILLRAMGAKHRSWQTHCLAITGGIAAILPVVLETIGRSKYGLGTYDVCILRLLIYGLTIGIMSHLVLDAITPEGIHLVPGVKIKLVPNVSLFRTGGPWEKIVLCLLGIGIVVVLLFTAGLIRL